ncbi:MAG: DUF3015 domain-containing protein [Nevskiales bacterium]|nr:DUF3015 domain-containing protein [Nevskiales bacterium]
MKKAVLAAALVTMMPVGAALADNDIGCGLGTQLMKGQEGVLFKVLGATTNGTFGNQTFGITSGTLGCSSNGVITAEARRSMFASANLDQLAAEVAAGEGETLETLASLYQIEDADRDAFYALTQRQYDNLFSSADVTTGDVLSALDAAMAEDARLSHYVA